MTEKRVMLVTELSNFDSSRECIIKNFEVLQSDKPVSRIKEGKKLVDSNIIPIPPFTLQSQTKINSYLLKQITLLNNEAEDRIDSRTIPALDYLMSRKKAENAFIYFETIFPKTTKDEMVNVIHQSGIKELVGEKAIFGLEGIIEKRVDDFVNLPLAQALFKEMKSYKLSNVPDDNLLAYYVANSINSYMAGFLRESGDLLKRLKGPEQKRLAAKMSQYLQFVLNESELADLGIKLLICDVKEREPKIKRLINSPNFYHKDGETKKTIESHTAGLKPYVLDVFRKYKAELADFINSYNLKRKDDLPVFIETVINSSESHHADISENRTFLQNKKIFEIESIQDKQTQLLKISLYYVARLMFREFRQRSGHKNYLFPEEISEIITNRNKGGCFYNPFYAEVLQDISKNIPPEMKIQNIISSETNS